MTVSQHTLSDSLAKNCMCTCTGLCACIQSIHGSRWGGAPNICTPKWP